MDSYLYSIVERETVCDMLQSFHECIRLPVQLIDYRGGILESYGDPCNYCKIIKRFLPPDDTCEKVHINASQRAIELGETYIFSCHANLNHIVFPLVNQNTLFGSVLVGPFLMDEPDSTLVLGLDKRFHMSTTALLDLYEELDSIEIIPSGMVTHISRLLYYLFSDLILEGKHKLAVNKGKLYQQSRINESIQNLKAQENEHPTAYPIDLERELLTKVKTGNRDGAKAILNDLLGYVFFSEGNSLEYVKARSIELCSILSRAAIEGGATSDSVFRINNQFLMSQGNIHSLDDLCYRLQETVETFTECVFDYIPDKNSDIIKKSHPVYLPKFCGNNHTG